MGKKKFVDRKSSVTYAIVCADSSEAVGASAPTHVFVRVGGGANDVPGFETDVAEDVDTAAGRGTRSAVGNRNGANATPGAELSPDLREEIQSCGLPDDGYNYLQHLRTIDGHGAFVPAMESRAPSLRTDVKVEDARVSASGAAPLHGGAAALDADEGYDEDDVISEGWEDEEILSNLSDGTGDDDALDDDFVVRANGIVPKSEAPPKRVGSTVQNSRDRLDSSARQQDVERPARMLDLQFEKLILREYDEDCFDDEPIDSERSWSEGSEGPEEGSPGISAQKDAVAELLLSTVGDSLPGTQFDDQGPWRPLLSAAVKQCVVFQATEPDVYSSTDEESEVDKEDEWDCETVVSTFSNLDNHPATIEDPFRSKSTGEAALQLGRGRGRVSPADTGKGGLSPAAARRKNKNAASLLYSGRSLPVVQEEVDNSSTNTRNNSSRQAWKEHKVAMKQARREARANKKALKLEYRNERAQAQHVAAHGMAGCIRL